MEIIVIHYKVKVFLVNLNSYLQTTMSNHKQYTSLIVEF
jgi:hypothetical protein